MKQVTWRGTANPEISYRLISVSCQKFLGKKAENRKYEGNEEINI